jgi:hypothetical protein
MLDKFRPGSFLGFVALWPIIAVIMAIWFFVGWLFGN